MRYARQLASGERPPQWIERRQVQHHVGEVTARELISRRLHGQKLARPDIRSPGGVVACLGAMQAQDYPGAKWAVGLRAHGVKDADVEQAFNEGAMLRTHVLRPTWHFVTPADIRWMLALSAPRVHAVNAYYYRRFELTEAIFRRSRTLLERSLRDGTQLARAALATVLLRAGISADSLRLAYLMMHAELSGVICSGARRGRQFTYALLEERVPPAPALTRDEALAELTRRYFSSRGPASVRDYVWWSGLTVREAKAGLDAIKPGLEEARIDGRTYWFAGSSAVPRTSPSAYLLPNYDEFGIAYKDRDVMPSVPRPQGIAARDEFAHLLVIAGQLVGRWRRAVTKRAAAIEAQPFRPLTRPEQQALEESAARYGRFMNMPATVSLV